MDGGGSAGGADVGELLECAAQTAAGTDAAGVAALHHGVKDDLGVVALVKFLEAIAVGPYQDNAAVAAIAPTHLVGAVPDVGLGPVGVFGDVAR